MAIWIILIVVAYLLGSVPTSYLAARSRGIDLRQHGTNQVGGGNLWRTTSRKLGLLVGIFDLVKGLAMVWVAQLLGLETAQQLVVGLAAIIGHDWPVFLRFHGGRGIATSLGIIIILPFINHNFINHNYVAPWPTAAALAILIIGSIALRLSLIHI